MKKWYSILLPLIAVSTTACSLMKSNSSPLQPVDSNSMEALAAQKSTSWMQESWQGNDQPYAEVRNQLDQTIANSQNLDSLWQEYRDEALQNSHDPVAQFRWGYAAIKSITSFTPYPYADTIRGNVLIALLGVTSPNTYNYARLRYLASPNDPKLVGIGERLLKYSPDDDVQLHLSEDYASILGLHYNFKSKSRAIDLTESLIKNHPQIAKYNATLGSIYLISWYCDHKRNPADAKIAIAEYQKYLLLASANEPFRQDAQIRIRDLQKDLAH